METNVETELGRRVLARTVPMTSDANARILIPANKRRVALLVGNNTANPFAVNFTDPPAATQGVPLLANTAALLLSSLTIGDAVAQPIWLHTAVPAVVVFITEFIQGQ